MILFGRRSNSLVRRYPNNFEVEECVHHSVLFVLVAISKATLDIDVLL